MAVDAFFKAPPPPSITFNNTPSISLPFHPVIILLFSGGREQQEQKMEIINGLNVFLLLALSSLFFPANTVCVPRNSAPFGSPVDSLIAPQASPSQSSSPQPSVSTSPSPPAQSPTDSEDSALNSQESYSGALSPSDMEFPFDSYSSSEKSEKSEASEASSPQSPSSTPPTSASSSDDSTVPTDLEEICDVTSDPQLCTKSISSHIDESEVNPTSALKTEIEESIKEVRKAVTKLKSLRKSASKVEISCYDTCLETFDMAIYDLQSGLESIETKDTGTMESVLAAVMSDLTTCDDTFIEMGVDSPLDNLSSKMSKYASNCLAISKLLL
ncbi:hypothetical protein SDJN03_00276, partial [Cucurbita argyrosperma subsp. sororia]